MGAPNHTPSSDRRRLVLVRHAHRDNSLRSLDNGLSEVGRKQAEKLATHFKKNFELSNCSWLSSPKRRCIETLAPMAGEKLLVVPLLNEQESAESFVNFQSRVSEFLDNWKASSSPLTIASSHGDWIPEAILQTTRLRTEIGKSGWACLSIDESGAWILEDLILSSDLIQ
jgi:broad specificity phosphatase PhoE